MDYIMKEQEKGNPKSAAPACPECETFLIRKLHEEHYTCPDCGWISGYEESKGLEIGKKYLITTNEWFFGPDGNQYRAVFGTLKSVASDKKSLGISTNRHSTNWYAQIGALTVAGCQINYVLQTDKCSDAPATDVIDHNGKRVLVNDPQSRIYFTS